MRSFIILAGRIGIGTWNSAKLKKSKKEKMLEAYSNVTTASTRKCGLLPFCIYIVLLAVCMVPIIMKFLGDDRNQNAYLSLLMIVLAGGGGIVVSLEISSFQ
jgi:hypothetical protein